MFRKPRDVCKCKSETIFKHELEGCGAAAPDSGRVAPCQVATVCRPSPSLLLPAREPSLGKAGERRQCLHTSSGGKIPYAYTVAALQDVERCQSRHCEAQQGALLPLREHGGSLRPEATDVTKGSSLIFGNGFVLGEGVLRKRVELCTL